MRVPFGGLLLRAWLLEEWIVHILWPFCLVWVVFCGGSGCGSFTNRILRWFLVRSWTCLALTRCFNSSLPLCWLLGWTLVWFLNRFEFSFLALHLLTFGGPASIEIWIVWVRWILFLFTRAGRVGFAPIWKRLLRSHPWRWWVHQASWRECQQQPMRLSHRCKLGMATGGNLMIRWSRTLQVRTTSTQNSNSRH